MKPSLLVLLCAIAFCHSIAGVASSYASTSAPSPADLAVQGQWIPYEPFAQPGNFSHISVYDSLADRVVMYPSELAQVVQLSLSGQATWSPFPTVGLPPVRASSGAFVFDPIERRLIIIGGNYLAGESSHVLEFSLVGDVSQWNELHPTGAPPPGLILASAVYDRPRDRILVFGGGVYYDYPRTNQVWALQLRPRLRWTELSPAGIAPEARSGHVAVYDPIGDRMVVFGGFGATGPLNDTWTLSLSGTPTWSMLLTSSDPPETESATRLSAVYDPVSDLMIVLRSTTSTSGPSTDAWGLPLRNPIAWSLLTPPGPEQSVFSPVAVYDSRRDRMVVVEGGYTPNESWSLSLSGTPAWSPLSTIATRGPDARLIGHQSVYDPVGHRIIVFGGGICTGYGCLRPALWQLRFESPMGWGQVFPVGPAPDARQGSSAIYDPAYQRMVVFGGKGDGPTYFDDTWALPLQEPLQWAPISTTGSSPSARSYASAAYDPIGHQFIVFGGASSAGNSQDLWALSLGNSPAWTQLTPASSPPARSRATLTYDPVHDDFVLFGGSGSTSLNDTWFLSLRPAPQWTQGQPTGPLPQARQGHSAIYDPVRDRILVFGGFSGYTSYNDLWALTTSPQPTWSPLSPYGTAPAMTSPTATYVPDADQMWLVSGSDNTNTAILSWKPDSGLTAECPEDLSVTPGDIVDSYYYVVNHDARRVTFDAVLASSPDWPALPIAGRGMVDGFGRALVPIRIPVPGSDLLPATLAFSVFNHDDPAFRDSCSLTVGGGATPVLASFVGAVVGPDRIRLTWTADETRFLRAIVYRRSPSTDWEALGPPDKAGGDRLTYADTRVSPGARYAYRLGLTTAGYEILLGETWVSVPRMELALGSVSPNPAAGPIRLSFTLPVQSKGRVEVFDIAGRRRYTRQIGGLEAGTHSIVIDGSGWPAGVYLIQLVQDGSQRTAKLCVVR